jgi:twitching motility protein PilT
VAEELEGADRFRINVYRQRGQISIAVRRVSREIPSFEALHLPAVVGKIAEQHAGLILVAGITGAGKSTTIAAMLDHINHTRACHIVTIEDPIEYLYTDSKALVDQREVGIDVPDFQSALKYLMREDPDVVLIGEMRDRETFQAALQAAETGHLVFGTIHASGASSTVTRILDLIPAESRDLARQGLAFNLRAIICQRLLPCLAEGIDRVPAVEVLQANPSVRQLIEEARESELIDVIRSSGQEGMQDFNQSLLELIEKDYVDPKVAYEAATNPDELKMLMKGISSSRAGLLGR